MYIVKKIRNFLIGILAICYILFDEIMWERFAKQIYIYANLNKYYVVVLDIVEFKMNRYFILVLFLSFYGLSKVIEIYAIAVFSNGNIISGIIVYGLAFIPVVFAFAILKRGQEKLFTFVWFKYSYYKIVDGINYIKRNYMYRHVMYSTYLIKKLIMSKGIFGKLLNYTIKKVKHAPR
jgi:hypothetical protein